MLKYPAKLKILSLVSVFIYIQTLCMRASKALASLRICTDLPEPSLLDNVISTKKNSCADSYNTYIHRSQNKGSLAFLKELVLYFRRNGSRFLEQRYAITSPVCLTGAVHVFLHEEVTPDTGFDSISFICFK